MLRYLRSGKPLRVTLSEVREETVLDLDCVPESSETLEGALEVASVLLFMLSPRVTGPERGKASVCPQVLPM